MSAREMIEMMERASPALYLRWTLGGKVAWWAYQYGYIRRADYQDLATRLNEGAVAAYQAEKAAEAALGAWAEFVDRREFTRNNRHKAKTRY